MRIKSVFGEGEKIPERYTCDGDEVNPPLEFSGIPENCKSLVLILDDPDSPSKTWVHWILWNLDPKTAKIPENCVPNECIQGINDFGKVGYGGPCPREGTHNYRFRVYALDSELNLREGSTVRELENALDDHIIDSAVLTGVYSQGSE